jgi:hypothetical protein
MTERIAYAHVVDVCSGYFAAFRPFFRFMFHKRILYIFFVSKRAQVKCDYVLIIKSGEKLGSISIFLDFKENEKNLVAADPIAKLSVAPTQVKAIIETGNDFKELQ